MLRRLVTGLLTAFLLEVLIEAWLQAAWVKTLKNGLLLALLAATVALAVRERRRPRAMPSDYALAALALVIVLSGLFGAVPVVVIGQALWVYLRGAVVLYAIRVARPPDRWCRAMLWTVGGWAALNCAVAVVQVVVGEPAYTLLGWTDLSTAAIHRAQGFYEHPNDLGHLSGLALLGTLVWRHRLRWAAAALFAAGLAATQSRESLLGVAAGVTILAIYRRVPVRRLAAGLLAMIALASVPIVALPGVRAEVTRRFWGAVDALGVPIAHERPPPDLSLPVCGPPEDARQDGRPGSACRHLGPEREIRIVYAQQGVALLGDRPLLGYGAGTFGGIVALQHDDQWYRHPRWGPGGFDMLGFHGKSVDSFWLHLAVETGLIGLACYLAWLALLARQARHDPWAVAAVAFAVVVAVFSPALESPVVPPLMFMILGFSMRKGQDECS